MGIVPVQLNRWPERKPHAKSAKCRKGGFYKIGFLHEGNQESDVEKEGPWMSRELKRAEKDCREKGLGVVRKLRVESLESDGAVMDVRVGA